MAIQIHRMPELQAGLERMSDELGQGIAQRRIVNRLSVMLRSLLRAEAPKSGHPHPDGSEPFAKSIGFTLYGDAAHVWSWFWAASPMASFIIEGTPPHIIRARNARALMIPVQRAGGGRGFSGSIFGLNGSRSRSQQVAFFAQVQHPGTRPNDFRPRAMRTLRARTADVLREEAPRWIRGLT